MPETEPTLTTADEMAQAQREQHPIRRTLCNLTVVFRKGDWYEQVEPSKRQPRTGWQKAPVAWKPEHETCQKCLLAQIRVGP